VPNLQLSYAGHLSDRVQDLCYGTVRPEGIDLHFIALPPVEAFNRMLRGEFHCGEMSLATYVIRLARGDLPFVAIPVFPARTFRHGAIYVNTRAGIAGPRDLIGRRVGVPEYQMTAAVWVRGLLRHEHDVRPEDLHWISGGLAMPGRKPLVDVAVPGIRVEHVEDGTLFDMLLSGAIDALIAPQVPPAIREGWPEVAYLFPNFPEVERAYFRRTGIFPIMHVVVIQKDIYAQQPWVAASLTRAFEIAKDNCFNRLDAQEPLPVSIPWSHCLADEVRGLMGRDYWPYGVEKNRKTIEALCSYVFEQGLVPRPVFVDEMFASHVLALDQNKL
jgi:4,5-dihydroxyphthalate decarboxylase